ncbi:hypothetical protein LUZ100_gp40 [Pseudomonas phage LUZ100]|nr:hypothetical protein LUZ100_gp40 [Pseudomonas phage LUZ100]
MHEPRPNWPTCGWSRKDNLVRSAWMAAGSNPLSSIVHEVTNG